MLVADGRCRKAQSFCTLQRPFGLPLGPTIPAAAALLSLVLLVTGQDVQNLLYALIALGVGLALYLATRLAPRTRTD